MVAGMNRILNTGLEAGHPERVPVEVKVEMSGAGETNEACLPTRNLRVRERFLST
jgi:hypothetical protein